MRYVKTFHEVIAMDSDVLNATLLDSNVYVCAFMFAVLVLFDSLRVYIYIYICGQICLYIHYFHEFDVSEKLQWTLYASIIALV